MTRHKTIGQDTPFLTYAIFKRIAARKVKEDRRKLMFQRYKLALRSFIEKLIGRRSHASEYAVSIEDKTQY
tara:strand:+ start:166 stop:378 length:213 start_codon:yes stop_codon:yes gene_type:complete